MKLIYVIYYTIYEIDICNVLYMNVRMKYILSEKFITDGTFIHWFLVRESRSFKIFADVECNAKLNYLQKKIKVIFIILELEVRFFFS